MFSVSCYTMKRTELRHSCRAQWDVKIKIFSVEFIALRSFTRIPHPAHFVCGPPISTAERAQSKSIESAFDCDSCGAVAEIIVNNIDELIYDLEN